MWNDAEPEDEAAMGFFRPRSDDARANVACPPPELVQAWHTGVLPPEWQERVAAHVTHCGVCQTLGEALADSDIGSLTPEEHERILGRVHTELGTSKRAILRSRWWQWSAAAAGLALVATGAVLVWHARSTPSVFHLEKAAMLAPASTDLLWRGATDSGDLTHALEPYRADDFAEAARRLTTLVSRYPQSAAGHFYLGVSELFLGRDADAATALERAEQLAKDHADLAREARWYLALAYRRLGQDARAAGQLDTLCRADGPRAAQACAGLRELSAPLPTRQSR
jgi:TolA-binding protein